MCGQEHAESFGVSSVTQDKYRKTPVDEAAVEAFLVEQFNSGCEAGNRRSWCWTWMRRMIRCTENRRVVSTMATTGVTATCLCMCFARGMCWGPSCGCRTWMAPKERIVGQLRGEVAEAPHYAAGGQQLCPRGVDEMV